MIIPVPIPNTEVKRSHADGTAEMRESRTPPGLFCALRGHAELGKKFCVPTSFMSYEVGGGFQNRRAEKPGLF